MKLTLPLIFLSRRALQPALGATFNSSTLHVYKQRCKACVCADKVSNCNVGQLRRLQSRDWLFGDCFIVFSQEVWLSFQEIILYCLWTVYQAIAKLRHLRLREFLMSSIVVCNLKLINCIMLEDGPNGEILDLLVLTIIGINIYHSTKSNLICWRLWRHYRYH